MGRVVQIRELRDDERAAAAAALSDAFQRDAFATWLYPEPSDRRSATGQMFTGLLDSLPEDAIVEVTDDLDGVAVWQPPGSALEVHAPDGAAASVGDLFERIHSTIPAQPFWYLRFLGSRTLGAGNGSALLAHRHARVGDVPTALWTGAEVNLSFYGKNGYREIARHDADGASAWWMWRDGSA